MGESEGWAAAVPGRGKRSRAGSAWWKRRFLALGAACCLASLPPSPEVPLRLSGSRLSLACVQGVAGRIAMASVFLLVQLKPLAGVQH